MDSELQNDPLEVICERLTIIEQLIREIQEQRSIQDWYTIEEFSKRVHKAEFTCREWARLGRIRAEKRYSGRGKYQSWVVSHEELKRYQREGLLTRASQA